MALNINKHRLFKMAHAMIRKSEAVNLSDALRQAWKVMKLQAQLLVCKVHFTFRKVSGEIREAYGNIKSACSFIDWAMAILKSPHRINNQKRH